MLTIYIHYFQTANQLESNLKTMGSSKKRADIYGRLFFNTEGDSSE